MSDMSSWTARSAAKRSAGACTDFANRLEQGQLIEIEGIVEAFVFLHKQKRNAWSFEIDVRTSKESW